MKSGLLFLGAASTLLLIDNSEAFTNPRARNSLDRCNWESGYSSYGRPAPRFGLGPLRGNQYDSWASDGLVRETFPLTEDSVVDCLNTMKDSDYGKQMFGCNEKASSIGVTGEIQLVEVEGPFVVLSLQGEFWHKRSTVLGKAAIWLNACIPEIVQVAVADPSELNDFEDFVDEDTGELLYVHDKRSPDFNGDRGTMEYQGIDPDVRGPFPKQGFTINPM